MYSRRPSYLPTRAHQDPKLSFREVRHIFRNPKIGCYGCVNFFKASDITEWIDNGQTALCPICGIDAVVVQTPWNPILNIEVLNDFYYKYFNKYDDYDDYDGGGFYNDGDDF